MEKVRLVPVGVSAGRLLECCSIMLTAVPNCHLSTRLTKWACRVLQDPGTIIIIVVFEDIESETRPSC